MTGRRSVAIVGLACRFPDSDDPAAFFDVTTTGRRAFRRIPPCRHRPAWDHGARAAVIEGWRFDRAAFGMSQSGDAYADPELRLALETSGRALAAAGYPGGAGLPVERTGVIVAATETLADRTPPMATAIRSQLGLAASGLAIETGGGCSLAAVSSACSALTNDQIDVAVAGGVDLGFDQLDLAGLAKSGVLANGAMRIYDENPTGFLPGEGCGIVLLMRQADALRAGLPIYAQILGWGTASAARQRRASADPADADSLSAAMRRAYAVAQIDPADVALIEGCGAGVASADEAELAALAKLRAAANRQASFGAVTANIGCTGAAAGVAGLIKTVLATANGVLPPSTGISSPHPMIREGEARLLIHDRPEEWPDGPRYAAVSARGPDGLGVHLVLGGRPDGQSSAPVVTPRRRRREQAAAEPVPEMPPPRRCGLDRPTVFTLHAPDVASLTAVLSRIAEIATWLSDAELGDLACRLATDAAGQGGPCLAGGRPPDPRGHGVRVAIIATRQDQLARLAAEAISMLPKLADGLVATRPGIFASQNATGQVTVLLGGARHRQSGEYFGQALAVLARLDELGFQPNAAVGHDAGELAGLVWAGCISPGQAAALNEVRAGALAASVVSAPGSLSAAIDEYGTFSFRPPQHRLYSGCTGEEIVTVDAIPSLLVAELLDARTRAFGTAAPDRPDRRLAGAILAASTDAALLLRIGTDRDLTRATGQLDGGAAGPGRSRKLPVVGIDLDLADSRSLARAAGALFAAGAITEPGLLYPANTARPIDMWREPVFIARPTPVTGPRTHPAPDAETPADEEPVPGVASWHRCYVEGTREPAEPVPSQGDRDWRIYTGGTAPFCVSGELLDELDLVRHEPTAGRTLAILGPLHEAGTLEATVLAAQDAISTGELVAIGPDAGLTGFWASLHAEHPQVGVTSVRTPLTAEGLRAACHIAAEAGKYRELMIDADGSVRELVMEPAGRERGDGFAFGPGDVVLISRSAAAPGLALAEVLACSGAAIAVVGRDHPRHDDAVIATLEELRLAGAAVGYEIVNPASAAALDAAVGRIERRFGPVTAVAHAVGALPGRGIARLTPAEVHGHVVAQTNLLGQLVSAARGGDKHRAKREPGDRLGLIATFGSLIGRYGLAEEGLTALATAALANEGERLAQASPGCRAVHVDWPAWSGADLGERPDLAQRMRTTGIAPLPVADGARQLLRLLATAEPPSRSAVHGRLGRQTPRPLALAEGSPVLARGTTPGSPRTSFAWRFTERVVVNYPSVELIAEATICAERDPYITDYTMDGVAVLPPTFAIEAMAQVAATLAGRPMLSVANVAMAAPVVMSGPRPRAVLRICALATDEDVSVILRCEDTGFAVDHLSATFRCSPAEVQTDGDRRAEEADAGSAVLDADGIYGPVCFQEGRFQRLTSVWFTGSTGAAGLIEGPDEERWFGGGPPAPAEQGPEMVLGDPGVGDAALQLVQACVVNRRLMFAGCESARFSGLMPEGNVTVRATQVAPPPESAARDLVLVPGQRAGDPSDQDTSATGPPVETVWNVAATDANGRLVAAFSGLRMRDAGSLPHTEPQPPSTRRQLASADSR